MLKINGKQKLFSSLVLTIALAFGLVSSGFSSADTLSTHESEAHHEQEFNAGELIIHHVLDANEIHIADGLSIPLPMILFTEAGTDVFSFSNFWDDHHHATNTYTSASTGNTYAYEHGHLAIVDEEGAAIAHAGWGVSEHSFIDLSITKNVAGIFAAAIIMLLVFLSVAKAYKKRGVAAPKGLQSFMEVMIMFVRDEVAKPSIGKKYERFMPYLLTIFFFIWIGNMLGLIPFLGGLNITGNIAVTLALAVFTFILTSINANKGYWMHIIAPPGVPFWLLPIMLPIEIIGVLNKPIVLCLRLFANITAGHIIILSFTCLIFIFNASSGAGAAYGVSIGSVLFSVFMLSLELLVAFLQAYVFTLLSALYFGQAVEDHDHH
ncbi:MAG: F0F1 ATP synthase subunit A [Flavobacteriales bacterium]